MRPIDLQDNMSKAPLAGREQAIHQSSADLGQRHGAQELNRQHLLDQTRTAAAAEADDAENNVDDHPDSGRGSQGRRHGRHHSDTDATNDTEAPRPSAHSREIDLMA